jgi:hypothetical protein
MKTLCILFFLFLSSFWLQAQNVVSHDTIVPAKGNEKKQLKEIKKEKVEHHSDAKGSQPTLALVDTTVQNKYADLLNDDTAYNKRYPIWIPAVETFGFNALIFSIDRYVFKYDFATEVGMSSWKHNFKTGWEWDTDRFGVNFIGHPYSGNLSFNTARSTGYNFWQSIPFAVGGSLMWEYFGENTLPSYNDIINTPVSGVFLGELSYRLSSNILDDRTRGMERVMREIAAGIIDPVRGLNRIMQGKSFRKTNVEVYQKEPLNITLYGGVQKLKKDPEDITNTSIYNEILNLQLDYGNPFENRTRKPYDFFKLRVDLVYGAGRKFLDNVRGYGILYGKNYQSDSGNRAMLFGLYQYYDYWDNKDFELGAIGFGSGIITKLPVHKASKSNLYTSIHLAVIPFSGVSTRFGPDTSQYRDYNFGSGLEGKFETTINAGKRATATLTAYYYWIHSFVGLTEDNFITIIKPRVTVSLYKNLAVGFEPAFYYNDVHSPNAPVVHLARTELKAFIMLYLEDTQRRGHYN